MAARNPSRINPSRESIERRTYEPKELTARHHEILRLKMLGYKDEEIAEQVGVTIRNVHGVCNSHLGRQQTALIKSEVDHKAVEVAKEIRNLVPKALRILDTIMCDEEVPASVRLRAAQDALDRAGFSAVKRMDVNTTSLSLTSDDLTRLKETALARARENGLLIDVPSSPAPSSILPAEELNI